jgi:hypothetical protein
MGEPANVRDDSNDPEPTGPSEHEYRNRTQLELLKRAVERKRHAAYIEAMLERTTSDTPAAGDERTDAADAKDGRPDF